MEIIINRANCTQILIASNGADHISDMLRRLADELSEISNREVESITWDDDGIHAPELICIVHWRMKDA